jgi:response regulator RpfG family c-di-GMP phosphodiesterase
MFRWAYPAPLNDIGRQHVWPRLPSQEETIARSSKQCACGRCPAQAAAERHRHTVQRTCSIKAGEAATVVVVDDDPSALRALSRLIQAAGFRVLTFDRPSALLASALPRVNACMVVDINLPEMDGSELCSALAASGRGMPAILITGRNDRATQRLIEKAHVVTALFKPIDERGPIRRYRARARSF